MGNKTSREFEGLRVNPKDLIVVLSKAVEKDWVNQHIARLEARLTRLLVRGDFILQEDGVSLSRKDIQESVDLEVAVLRSAGFGATVEQVLQNYSPDTARLVSRTRT